MSTLASSLLLTVAAATAAKTNHHGAPPLPPRRNIHGGSGMPYLRPEDLHQFIQMPTNNNVEDAKSALLSDNWMSTSEDVEFLPLLRQKKKKDERNNNKGNKATHTTSRHLEDESTTTTGAHSESDPYSVQPFVSGMGDYDENQQAWRLLGFMIDCNAVSEMNDDYVASHNSGDQGTDEGCARYLLWAAYVDLEYEGK